MNTIKTPAANILDAMKWWGFLGSEQAGIFRDKYFPDQAMVSHANILHMYHSEYSQEKESVDGLSFEDVASKLYPIEITSDEEGHEWDNNSDIRIGFIEGANWQKEQYRDFIASYMALKNALIPFANLTGELTESKIQQGGNVFQFNSAILAVADFLKATDVIEKANTILLNLKP